MKRLLGLLWAVSLLLVASQGLAGDRALAKRLFESGVDALKQRKPAVAAQHFERALAEYPTAATAFNLATAYSDLGRAKAALALHDALLGGQYGALKPEQAEQVRKAKADAEKRLAEVVLRVPDAPKAKVRSADGVISVNADNGRAVLLLDPGRYTLSIEAPGFRAARLELNVGPGGRVEKQVKLTRAAAGGSAVGLLRVESDEPKARVEIVGHGVGTGAVERRLSPGRYRVRVTHEQRSVEAWATVKAGGRDVRQLEIADAAGISPWIWVAAGAAVVVGVTVGYFLTRDEPEQTRDPHFGRTETLIAF